MYFLNTGDGFGSSRDDYDQMIDRDGTGDGPGFGRGNRIATYFRLHCIAAKRQ